MSAQNSRTWQTDDLVRVAAGTGVALALLTFAGLLATGRGQILPPLTWFVPMTQAFVTLSAFALALLCFGRFQALGGAWTFWAGVAFLTNGILGTFYVLAWPDLPDDRGLIGTLPSTSAWLFILTYSSLALLAVAAIARQPARLGTRQRIVAYIVTGILPILAGLLSILLEDALPITIMGDAFTPLTLVWQTTMIVLLSLGAVASVRRYLLEGDRFLGYLAIFLVVMDFALLGGLIGGERYNLWWYGARLFYIPPYVVMLFGMLQEGYVLYRSERMRAEHLAALNEVSRTLGTMTDLKEVGRQAVEIAARVARADAAGLYLREEGTGLVSLVASLNLSRDFIERYGVWTSDEHSIVGQIITKGQPLISGDQQISPLTREAMQAAGVRAFAGVPVQVRDNVVGMLAVGRTVAETFSEENVQLLSSIGDQIGVAVENARLYEAIRSINERLAVTSIRAQELAEEAQRRADELNALIESMAEGVMVVDAEGRIARLNRAGREVLGIPNPQEVLDVPVQSVGIDLRYPDDRPLPGDEWPISRALRGETFAQQEVLYIRPDGSRRNLLFAGSAVGDDTGKVALAVNVYRDITPIRELEQQREEFISVVAHDLRGALTSVKGFSDLLTRPTIKGTLPAMVQRAAEGISSGSRRIERMITDLLDVSRIEARRLTLVKKPVNLASLVRDVVQRSTELTKEHSVRVEIHGDIPEVEADPDRFEQILTNLLSNAGKYSYPDSEVTVEVEPRPHEVMVSVTNLGQGILPEDEERLFTRFHRTKQAQEEKVPGLGLGLYIAKGLVEAHGGQIWVESKPGEYATFHFTMPA